MASVTLDCVSKTYRSKRREVCAVRELSLRIEDGELLAVVGPSGCGKTTLLRLIAGLESADSGTISIADAAVNNVSPRDRDVAMVFQDYALYPHMSVFKNLGFGLKMRGARRDEILRKVTDVAQMLDIETLLDRKPGSLSGGEQQRVALGRAIVRRPRVFLFDEPLSNLDAARRRRTRSEIKSLRRNLGATMIYVTHDQEEAMSLGNRVAVLRDGVLQQCDRPLAVYDHPKNRFVAGFIGSPPMNFLTGRVEVGPAGNMVDCALGVFPVPVEVEKYLRSLGNAESAAEIVVGVRPEHLRVGDDVNNADSQAREAMTPTVDLSVADLEPLGDSTILHLIANSGEQLLARVPAGGDAPLTGRANVCVPQDRLHYFALGETGRQLG